MAYAAGWFAAGVLAVLLGSVSVSMVGHRVTGSRPAPLNASEVRHELEVGTVTSTTVPLVPTTAPPPPTTTTTASPTAPPPSRPVTSTTMTTVATTHRTEPAELRTYTLVGGTVTLRFAASGVTVEVATPNPGFALDVELAHDTGVRVELESDEHRSRVEGWWDGGPRDEVHEEDD